MATPQWAMSGDEHGDEQDEQRVDAELASKKVWRSMDLSQQAEAIRRDGHGQLQSTTSC